MQPTLVSATVSREGERRRPARRSGRERKRILIVNAYFDDLRRTTGSPNKIPQAMGTVYLAGAFAKESCEVRLYNEQASGMLRDVDLLGWPDMLVLTGLTCGFDRLLHLTAYARTLNPAVIVVAGGPAVRALPTYSQRFFDYASTGDLEDLARIVGECFGPEHVAAEMFPRFDLCDTLGFLGHVESSRYCNFRCSFCSLTGENTRYQKYDLDYLRRQILAVKRRQILLIDNNFYGNDRDFFLARVALLREMVEAGHIRGWSALVTGDFFTRDDNLELVRQAGCMSLFSGVESFDETTLRSYQKRQNTLLPQVEMIRKCLEAGIVFQYGIMLDVTRRHVADLRREIEFITGTPEITLPGFFTLAIPLLKTPYFYECLREGLFLPNLILRNLDGCTLSMRPLDPVEEVLPFISCLQELRGYGARVARHSLRFLWKYGRALGPLKMAASLANGLLTCAPRLATSPKQFFARRTPRTYYSATEPLDPHYTPLIHLDGRFEPYFRPTPVTDESGGLAEELVEDLMPSLPRAASGTGTQLHQIGH